MIQFPPFLSKPEATAVVDVWRKGVWRTSMQRELAVKVVDAYLKKAKWYPETATVYLPKPDHHPGKLLANAPADMRTFPPSEHVRWKVTGTRAQLQYRVNKTYWKPFVSDSLYDFAGMLLTEGAQLIEVPTALKAGQVYEERQDRNRQPTSAHGLVSSSRARLTACLAEAYRRTLAGCPGPQTGAASPQPWLFRLLWQAGYSDRWRAWYGDSYLTEPATWVFGGGPSRQALWYENADGKIVRGDDGAVACIEVLSDPIREGAMRVDATVVIATPKLRDTPTPVMTGRISCSNTGILRSSGLEQRTVPATGPEYEAWQRLLAFYRSRA